MTLQLIPIMLKVKIYLGFLFFIGNLVNSQKLIAMNISKYIKATLVLYFIIQSLFICAGNPGSEIKRDTSWTHINGAFRLNMLYTWYEGKTSPLGTSSRNEFTWDTWRIGVHSYSKGIELSFQYRFYPTFNTHFIHHGWLGYHFTPETNVKVGISQVPFGDLPFGSHSWWFQAPYYVGLEDDYQTGISLEHSHGKLLFHFAYYLMAEPRGTSEASYGPFSAARYSYDVVPIPGNSNIERNQFNVRGEYHFGTTRAGISMQTLQIYNQALNHNGNQQAVALHLNADIKRWNLKLQSIYYQYNNVKNDDGLLLNTVQMGAYGFGTYDVASEAAILTAGLAYTLPVEWGPVSSVQFYDDIGYMHKFESKTIGSQKQPFEQSVQNVLGALITAGNVYTYVDLASGYNHPWLSGYFGGSAMGSGNGLDPSLPVGESNPISRSAFWNTRLNINIGYYF